jgi:hypothetical protein
MLRIKFVGSIFSFALEACSILKLKEHPKHVMAGDAMPLILIADLIMREPHPELTTSIKGTNCYLPTNHNHRRTCWIIHV